MAEAKDHKRTGAVLAFGVPALMLLLAIFLCPYRIWFAVGRNSQSWMQTSGLFLFGLPVVLMLCTALGALSELVRVGSSRKFLDQSVMASQIAVCLYIWPLLFSLETLAKQEGDRLILSDAARADLGVLAVFAKGTMRAPYGWAMAALITALAIVVMGFIVLRLRGKWKEAIGWPLIALAVGFGLTIGA